MLTHIDMREHFLHKQIDRQGQKCGIPVLLTVSRHYKQQQNDHQISRIQIFRKQLTKKIAGTCLICVGIAGLWPGLRRWRRRRTFFFLLWRLRRNILGFLDGFFYPVPAVRTVRLGNIAVIHGLTCLNRINYRSFAARLLPWQRSLLHA